MKTQARAFMALVHQIGEKEACFRGKYEIQQMIYGPRADPSKRFLLRSKLDYR